MNTMLITNYAEAVTRLGNRESRKLANNTYLQRRDPKTIAVKLHATDIITYHADGRIVLNSGGYRTMTTKARLREFAPVHIEAKNGVWYCYAGTSEATFADGITYRMTKNGNKLLTHGGSDPAKQLKQRAAVRQYAREFVSKLVAGEILAPTGGDCWFCLMRETKTGKPLGDITRNADHIKSHISKGERYYVPSMLVNALDHCGAGVAWRGMLGECFAGTPSQYTKDLLSRNMPRFLTRYLYAQLGMAR